MRPTLARLLDSRRQVYAASAVTLALGLFFLFVWSPLPWGWEGIDHYHDRAIRLASGLAFDTTDYPWGYPYYIAAFYAIFGSHAWIPLLAQALLNALVPWLLYHLVHPLAGQRVAVLSAVLVGVLSFNTVYVSTQSSDCVSTVIFLSGLVLVSRGIRGGGWWPLAAAGLMAGLAPQFRPNLILFPPIAAAGYVAARRVTRTAMMQVAVYLGVAGLALLPWIVRNYRLTETFVPTSTHGGLQLWYGTLQVGPYLESRAHNPRSAFESSAFDYTSIVDKPIIISGKYARCLARGGERVDLVYWTDRDPQHRRATPQPREHDRLSVEVLGQPAPTVFYYYFEAAFPEGDGEPATRFLTPLGGADTPLVAFVATDHLGDLDRHDDLLDIFDVVRLVRHLAWDEPLDRESLLDVDHNGRLDDQDVSEAVALLVPERPKAASIARPTILERGAGAAVIHLPDGSRLMVPRTWRGRQTDLAPEGEMASTLVSRWRSYASIAHPPERLQAGQCLFMETVTFNDVFYRRELHAMGRYMALAFDNIGRDPWGFAAASLYRMVRLFIIRGTDDQATTQQFAWARLAYGAGFALSATYFAVFVAGGVVALRRRSAVLWLLVPIAYVPLTIGFVLTNMRYTITVQPLMFVFVAMALVAALRLDSPDDGERARA